MERIDRLENLRAEIDTAIRELDAGLGEELDMKEFIRQLRAAAAGTEDMDGRNKSGHDDRQ